MMSVFITLTCKVNSNIFFFNDTATTEIYTLSLHDALPIFVIGKDVGLRGRWGENRGEQSEQSCGHTDWKSCCHSLKSPMATLDRKSTRLNSSHGYISYAVFCLKKTKTYSHGHVSCILTSSP